jgi:hypothetical protein
VVENAHANVNALAVLTWRGGHQRGDCRETFSLRRWDEQSRYGRF